MKKKIIQGFFKKNKRPKQSSAIEEKVKSKTFSISHDYSDRIAEVSTVLNPKTGAKYEELYKKTIQTESEIHNIIKQFDTPVAHFTAELTTINEINQTLFVTTIEGFDKTFNNTQMRDELVQSFRSKVDKNILEKIVHYENSLNLIQIKLLEIRLSPFDTSIIDGYISSLKALHYKIEKRSGLVSNKHSIIAQNIMSNLLPSLIKTWNMSRKSEEKREVEAQFEQLIFFLEGQLAALDNTADPSCDSLSLSFNCDAQLETDNVSQQIGKNDIYIKSLISNWC